MASPRTDANDATPAKDPGSGPAAEAPPRSARAHPPAAVPAARVPAPSAGPDDPWVTLGMGVEVRAAAWTEAARRVLTPAAVRLLASLERELAEARRLLLEARRARQAAWDGGNVPGYLPDSELPEARGEWRIAELPPDLRCRRVEITGPISDAKMVINMLSRTESGHRADAAMLDFEDALKPAWANVMRGVENLIGVVDGTLTHERPAAGGRPAKTYRLDPEGMPLVMVRVRGLHLDESNVRVDGRPVSAGLLDFVLSAHHTASALAASGRTPKYYVPKCEHHLEARWWNRLFTRVEESLGLAAGTVRATFLIETLPAAFQVEEILYEIREHAAGLNVGRWDKIFSDIKVLMRHADRVLPDRGSISLNRSWMMGYALRLIRVCHRHGAMAMGGMAAFTPGRTADRRAEQERKVLEDKRLEAEMGHDGCWVSHPYFIGTALSAFDRPNQLHVMPDPAFERPDLLPHGGGPRTLAGLRKNARVGIAYLEGWHRAIGCVAWDDLMEDLATLEISRAQTWQWLHHGVTLDDGERVTPELVRRVFTEELDRIRAELRAGGAGGMGAASAGASAGTAADGGAEEDVASESARFEAAAEDAAAIFTEERFRPFLTCRSELAGTPPEEARRTMRESSACG